MSKAKITIKATKEDKRPVERGDLVIHKNGQVAYAFLDEGISIKAIGLTALAESLTKSVNQSAVFCNWRKEDCKIWEGSITISNKIKE